MKEATVDQFVQECDGIARGVDDFTDLLTSFIPLHRADVQSNFANSQTAGGNAWPARKDSKPHPLLRLSGALEAAATGVGAGHVESITGNTLTYGVDGIIYAARQNFGDVPGSRDNLGRRMNIPAREYMALNENTADQMAEMTADSLAAKFQ